MDYSSREVPHSNFSIPSNSGNRGSTLIETLIYLALFSIIIGGVLVSAYQIIAASTQSQENALIQEEGHFLVAKINWAIGWAAAIDQPIAGAGPDSILDVSKGADFVIITVSGTDLTIQKNGMPFPLELNSDSVKVEGVQFTHTDVSLLDDRPAQIDATFTVTSKLTGQSQIFSTTKYLRK